MAALRSVFARAGLILVALIALAQISSTAVAAAEPTEYDLVYNVAHAQLGDQWKHYAKGPNQFDCVGFVWYAFHENALQDRIGGYRGVAGYLHWFKERGLVSKTDPRVGDLVI